MTPLQDAVAVLNDDVALFAFLPGTNYVFLLIQGGQTATFFVIASGVSAILGTVVYNYLSADSNQEETDGQDLSGLQRSILGFCGLTWLGLLIGSMWDLFHLFPKNWILPELLFFTSLSFISLFATDFILEVGIRSYEGNL